MKISVAGTGGGPVDADIASLLSHDPAGVQSLSQSSAAQSTQLNVNGIAVTSETSNVADAIQGITLTIGTVGKRNSGTRLRFWPDPGYFDTPKFAVKALRRAGRFDREIIVGVPDEKTGEAVKLVIVKKDPALTEADVRAFCEANLTGYKRPKVVEFRPELPKTPVGKILRRELRDKK